MDADNQQGSRSKLKWFWIDPSETTRRAPRLRMYRAYLQGALHDGTYNRLHRTFRYVQKERSWLERLELVFRAIGIKSWIYKEGKTRNLFALETTAPFLQIHFDSNLLLDHQEKIAYVRAYFDSEGGVPHKDSSFYIQFAQKNLDDINGLRSRLMELKISCGVLHNPSIKKDPDYWRFFVLRNSHDAFMKLIGSWHPRKENILKMRMVI